MNSYSVWSDGSIINNGQPGAFSTSASLIEKHNEYGGDKRFLVSIEQHRATSNRAEMLGAIQALEYIKWGSEFKIYSDSEYLVKGFNERMDKWASNGWKTGSGRDVSNKDLWNRLVVLSLIHKILFIWVKGHNGDENNEIVDNLAKKVLSEPQRFQGVTNYLGKKLIFLEV